MHLHRSMLIMFKLEGNPEGMHLNCMLRCKQALSSYNWFAGEASLQVATEQEFPRGQPEKNAHPAWCKLANTAGTAMHVTAFKAWHHAGIPTG